MTPNEYKVTSIESIEFGYKICLELSENDRYEFILSPEQYKEYGTKAGETISEEVMQAMRTDMQFYSAVRRAYDILSYGENTKNQLIYKLVKRGFKRPLAIQVAEYMKEKGYIRHFGDCCDGYRALYQQAHNILPVTATTAVPLSPAQEARLTEKLHTITGKTIELANHVDAAVLGGMRLDFDGKRLDDTVAHRMDALRAMLQETVL